MAFKIDKKVCFNLFKGRFREYLYAQDSLKFSKIIKKVCDDSGINYHLAKYVYYSINKEIVKNLCEGKVITIPILGTFYFNFSQAKFYKSYNHLTPAHLKVKFKISQNLYNNVKTSTFDESNIEGISLGAEDELVNKKIKEIWDTTIKQARQEQVLLKEQ